MKAKLLCVCVVFLAAQIYGISSNGLDDSTILGLLDNVSATNGSNRLLYSYIAAERNLLAGSSRLEQWIRFTLKSNSECKSEFSKCLSGVAYSPLDKSIMLEQYVTCLQLAIQGDLRKALEVRAEIASTGALAPLEKNIRALAAREVWCLADAISGVAHAARPSETSNSWDRVVIGYRIPGRISRPENSGELATAGLIIKSEFSNAKSGRNYIFDEDCCRQSDDEGSVYVHLILKRSDCREDNKFLSKSIGDKIVEVCARYGVSIGGKCTINGCKKVAFVTGGQELENVVERMLRQNSDASVSVARDAKERGL